MPAWSSKPRSRTAEAGKAGLSSELCRVSGVVTALAHPKNVATITNRVGDDPTRCVRLAVQARAEAQALTGLADG